MVECAWLRTALPYDDVFDYGLLPELDQPVARIDHFDDLLNERLELRK